MTGRVDGTSAEATQLGFDGMPKRLLQAAPSRLVTYLDCPRRYRLSYLDRPAPPKGPPWAHNSLGAAVHTALANWWKLPVLQRTVERAGELLDDAWLSDGFRDEAQRQLARVRARDMVTAYVAELDPCDEPVGRGADGRVEDRSRRPVRPGRSDRRQGERGPGDRRLQDRTPPAHRR